ncbi:MAG: tail fiber domain-containing protein [Parasphingorhabdus sp.]
MADEQNWVAYPIQSFLAPMDTLLVQNPGGAGSRVEAKHIIHRELSAADSFLARVIGADKGIKITNVGVGNAVSPLATGVFFHHYLDAMKARIVSLDKSGSYSRGTLVFGVHDGTSGVVDRLSVEYNGAILPGADNTQTLGSASLRYAVLYAGTGTINTSDERHKTWRSGLSEDEYAAALQIIDELGFFQWNDAIAEKGPDDARYHFGVRAQQAFDILDDHLGEGAWHDYAFACHDSWDDELGPIMEEQVIPAVLNDNGEMLEPERTEMVDSGETQLVREAGDIYGLREGEFTMFLLAAQARRQKELEIRIEALEA